MWSRRKQQENNSDEDAELRALVKTYKGLYDKSNPLAKSQKAVTSPAAAKSSLEKSSMDAGIPELSPDDIIRGSSITYTRAEAKLYANEEPCDTWRHFDVPTSLLNFPKYANSFFF